MSTERDSAVIVGVGVAACAVCCAGPILGFLAAIGLGTAVGVATFGVAAFVVGAIAVLVVLGRRRRRQVAGRDDGRRRRAAQCCGHERCIGIDEQIPRCS